MKGKNQPLFTKCNLKISSQFNRIEKGGRGSYYEIHRDHILKENLYIPKEKEWKLNNQDKIDYIEYRTDDKCNVKIYYQIRTVDYANYIPKYYYVSVKEVNPFKLKNLECY